MKLPDDFWKTEADEPLTLASLVGAMAVLALFCVVLYLAYLTFWAAS